MEPIGEFVLVVVCFIFGDRFFFSRGALFDQGVVGHVHEVVNLTHAWP